VSRDSQKVCSGFLLDFRFFFAYAYNMAEAKDLIELNRPRILSGQTIRVRSPFGTIFVTLNETEECRPFELFLNAGKCGSDITADAEAIGRLCSVLLRIPSPIPELKRIEIIIRHLSGIAGSKDVANGEEKIRSIPDAIAAALKQYLERKK
jgi:ribonucleoside-diphosphate reductase alpha chain